MASAFSHAVVAVAIGKGIGSPDLTRRVLLIGAVCSILPDCDVIGFSFGIRYGDLLGHRGLTHSLLFAAMVSGGVVLAAFRRKPVAVRLGLWLYLFLSTASHGWLDAMTDGGLGVAFFSPFDTTRYFFPYRPVLVSPIGVSGFFSEYGMHVLASEALWIWCPSIVLVAVLRLLRLVWRDGHAPHDDD